MTATTLPDMWYRSHRGLGRPPWCHWQGREADQGVLAATPIPVGATPEAALWSSSRQEPKHTVKVTLDIHSQAQELTISYPEPQTHPVPQVQARGTQPNQHLIPRKNTALTAGAIRSAGCPPMWGPRVSMSSRAPQGNWFTHPQSRGQRHPRGE